MDSQVIYCLPESINYYIFDISSCHLLSIYNGEAIHNNIYNYKYEVSFGITLLTANKKTH